MANVIWTGGKQSTPQVDTYTVTAVAVAGTLTVTINGKSIVYTCITGDTTATAAAGLYALLIASTEGEFSELTYSNSSSAIMYITGPTDGAPFTMTKGDAGGATSTLSTTTSPVSPHDLNAAANYSGGSLPINGDVVIFENSDVSVKYNLSALTAVTATIIRRDTFTGTIGLPDTNANGYVEYRARFLEFAGTTHRIEQASSDGAEQIRFKVTSGSASTVTITGTTSGTAVGSEAIHLWGQVSTSVLNVAGASVAVAPNTGQTNVATTILGNGATVRIGPGATITTFTATNCNGAIQSTITTLNMDRGGDITVHFAAAITNVNIDGGTVTWLSTGVPDVSKIGSGGVLELSQAPASLAPTSIEMFETSSLFDRAGRLANSTPIDLTRCGIQDVTIDFGTHRKITLGAHS